MIYLIRSKASGLHKIGITSNWTRRSRELEVGRKTVTVTTARVFNAAALERSLHQRYASARLPQSEWFTLTPIQLQEVIAAIHAERDACSKALAVMKDNHAAIKLEQKHAPRKAGDATGMWILVALMLGPLLLFALPQSLLFLPAVLLLWLFMQWQERNCRR